MTFSFFNISSVVEYPYTNERIRRNAKRRQGFRNQDGNGRMYGRGLKSRALSCICPNKSMKSGDMLLEVHGSRATLATYGRRIQPTAYSTHAVLLIPTCRLSLLPEIPEPVIAPGLN